ncbi:hypothetical protein L218DRAFT_1000903 [Marasmius fiardii PR-910]|nr:hypothetical protein L218DRAFT_1000903 [Marasmius fiardii PR-910]
MRLRLESSPPLPHLKAWFSSSQTQWKISTQTSQHKTRPQYISDLKKSLCTTIKPLSEAGINANEIVLELDGFELLDDSTVDELLREGDLVVVGVKEGSANLDEPEPPVHPAITPEHSPGMGKKRKLNANAGQPSHLECRKKRQKRVSSSPSSPESSSSSESSESESGSSTSSSSSSSSESDSEGSDSDASSTNSSSPSEIRTKPKPPKSLPERSQAKNISRVHVPPGQGSSQTRKRNLRRRLKRFHDTAAARGEEISPPPKTLKRLSEANQAPLGSRSRDFSTIQSPSTFQVVPSSGHEETGVPDGSGIDSASAAAPYLDPSRDAELNFSMFSLGNKNKKKGFKKQPSNFPKVMGKIVFSADEQLPQTPESSNVRDSMIAPENEGTQDPVLPYMSEPVPQARPRLIPPTEKQALGLLPRNVWVSSVDVEEGLGKSKKKRKKQNAQVIEEVFADRDRTRVHQAGYVSCQREEAEVVDTLNYGDVEEPVLAFRGEGDSHTKEEDTKSILLWSIAEQSFDSLPAITAEGKEGVIHAGVVVGWKALALNPISYCPEILLHLATVLSTSSLSISRRKIARPGWEDYVEEDQDEEVEWERVTSEGWRVVKPK